MATPTTTSTATRRGSSGKMIFSLSKLPEPLLLEQDTIDPKWNKFKTYFGVWVGGFCFMAWVVFLSFNWGASSRQSAPAVFQQTIPVDFHPPVVREPRQVVRPAPEPVRELTPEELDRRHTEYLRSHGQ